MGTDKVRMRLMLKLIRKAVYPKCLLQNHQKHSALPLQSMSTFDYTAEAELFPARSWKVSARRVTYKRFAKLPRQCVTRLRSFRLTTYWAHISRSKKQDSTAGAFDVCMTAPIIR